MSKRLFHYTVGKHINHIISEGTIRLETDGGVSFNSQRPAVWSSFRSEWEPICNKMWETNSGHIKRLNKDETEQKADGLYRIEIVPDSSPHDWESWKNQSGVSSQMSNKLLRSANDLGSDVNLWRVSFEPITKRDWVVVEKWHSSKNRWIEDTVSMWAL